MSPVPKEEQDAGTWSDLVQDPVARSALLGMGLQLMTGGWGNATQQLAAGLGAGATSAAGTSEALQKQLESEDKMASAEANQSANRANALKIAELNANNRVEIANLRGQARLDAIAAQAASKIPANDLIKYRAEARKIVEGNVSNMALPQIERETLINDIAMRTYEADQFRRGAAGNPGAPAASSPNAPAAAPGAVPGRLPAPQSGAKPAAQNPKGASSALANPEIQRMLSTPEGRDELKRRNPQAADILIKQWDDQQKGVGGWADRITKGIRRDF